MFSFIKKRIRLIQRLSGQFKPLITKFLIVIGSLLAPICHVIGNHVAVQLQASNSGRKNVLRTGASVPLPTERLSCLHIQCVGQL